MMEKQEPKIDVDTIMREIRSEILIEKGRLSNTGLNDLNINGKRFSNEFYDKLYQVGVGFNDMTLRLNVTSSSLPLIGPLIDRLRTVIHQLVLYYVNLLAEEQAQFNRLMVDLVNRMSIELEENSSDD